MARFSNIPSGREFWTSTPVVAALGGAALLLMLSAVRIGIRAWRLSGERAVMAERIQYLEAERERLEQATRALGTPEAVERAAKEHLNLKNAGEEVVVVEPEVPPPPRESGGRFWNVVPTWLRELAAFLRR